MTILDQLNAFKGTLDEPLVFNFLTSAPSKMPGTPFAEQADTSRRPVGSDLTLAKHLGLTNVKGLALLANQGLGKTFTISKLALNWANEDIGVDKQTGVSKKSVIHFDSLKRNNNGVAETDALLRLLKGVVIAPLTLKINALGRAYGFTRQEQFDMVARQISVLNRKPLAPVGLRVLRQCLDTVNKLDKPSYPRLVEVLHDYRAPRNKNTRVSDAKRMDKAAFDLELAVQELAEYFSGEDDGSEFVHLISQQAVSWDFKGVEAMHRSLIEVFRGAIEMSAVMPAENDPDGKPKHPERCANVIIRDEYYDAWKNPEFAPLEFRRLKTLRERDVTIVMSFHRLSDLFEAIGDGKAGVMARNSLKEIPIWMVGRQHEHDLPMLRDFLHLPEFILQTLPTLSRGFFWLIRPDAPYVLIFVLGTEMEIEQFSTDDANTDKLKRFFETHDRQYYLQYLFASSPPPEELAERSKPNEGIAGAR